MLIALVAGLTSLVYLVTAYALIHFVRGVPTYASVLFSLAVVSTLALAVLVAARLLDVFRSSKAGIRGARLHRRLVGLLSLVAVLPAIVAFALTGAVLQSFSDEYFVERVTEANLVARDFANGYVNAESRKMGVQVVQLATDLARQAQGGLTPQSSPIGFRRYLLGQTILRGFSGVTLLDRDFNVMAAMTTVPDTVYRLPPAEDFAAVSAPGATPFRFSAHDRASFDAWYAILKLGPPDEGYLVVYKAENPALSSQLVAVRAFRDETVDVRERLSDLSRIFAAGYGLVMVLLLLCAVWIGLMVANTIVGPVRRLAVAAEAVSTGELSARVDVRKGDGELGDLGRTFNDMTAQLSAQRADLVAANEEAASRARFIETVVSGVPAGVMNIAADGTIALANPSARRILGAGEEIVGRAVAEVAPELLEHLESARASASPEWRDQAELRREGLERIINIRISPDGTDPDASVVVTLDDITELVSAQRNAAWGDVARRIAHEIKNPLTPIQLSAERLKRRYGEKVGDDREVFDRCTDTIIRHVGDIGRMVNEFSSFARMPEPIMADEDVREIVRSAAFSFTVAHPSITFEHVAPDRPVMARCDGRLIGQVVVNLVKNAVEAITEGDADTGRIVMTVEPEAGGVRVSVADNGRGLPAKGRSRLTEPYMTTRSKGTGLGLAIVRKAIEEHGGEFALIDRGAGGGRGATASFLLPGTATGSGGTHAVLEKEEG